MKGPTLTQAAASRPAPDESAAGVAVAFGAFGTQTDGLQFAPAGCRHVDRRGRLRHDPAGPGQEQHVGKQQEQEQDAHRTAGWVRLRRMLANQQQKARPHSDRALVNTPCALLAGSHVGGEIGDFRVGQFQRFLVLLRAGHDLLDRIGQRRGALALEIRQIFVAFGTGSRGTSPCLPQRRHSRPC